MVTLGKISINSVHGVQFGDYFVKKVLFVRILSSVTSIRQVEKVIGNECKFKVR